MVPSILIGLGALLLLFVALDVYLRLNPKQPEPMWIERAPAWPPANQPPLMPIQPDLGAAEAPQPHGEATPFTLASVRRSGFGGVFLEFVVEYRRNGGGLPFGSTVTAIIESPRGTYQARLFPLDLRQQGTFRIQVVPTFGPDDGPFKVWLEEGLGVPFAEPTILSNKFEVN